MTADVPDILNALGDYRRRAAERRLSASDLQEICTIPVHLGYS
jgi:hypothetical protein